eukprot:COSAG01_NODE_2863_length_6958_cov_7.166351_2_plen_1087_part_00
MLPLLHCCCGCGWLAVLPGLSAGAVEPTFAVMAKKGRKGFSSASAAAAIEKRWYGEGAEGAARSDSDGSSDVEPPAKKQDTRQRPARSSTSPVDYAEHRRGTTPFSQMSGCGDPLQMLRKGVGRVLQVIQDIGKGAAEKTRELLVALFRHPRVTGPLADAGQPTEVDQLIATGVASKMHAMREAHLHQDTTGRLLYNALRGAAVSEFADVPGLKAQAARTLGIHRSSLYAALEQEECAICSENGVVILDPTRELRKDCLPAETVGAVQTFWAAATRPSPDKHPIATLRLKEGAKLTHGIHWQEQPLDEIYEKYLASDSPMVGKEKFRQLKPYFVRDPSARACLCPTCHVTGLYQDSYAKMLAELVQGTNTCACDFCVFHKSAHVLGTCPPTSQAAAAAIDRVVGVVAGEVVYPPPTSRRLIEACLCSKPECVPGSGFQTERYPVHSVSCFRTFLVGRDAKFVDGEKNNHAELPSAPEPCTECSQKFRLFPGSDCEFAKVEDKTVTYKHYVTVPRLGNPSATREALRESTVPRAEFIEIFREQWSKYLLHVYVCDWQDAASDLLISSQKKNHMTLGMDFAMNYTCVPKDELKAEFWCREQVSLHTMIAYHEWPPDYEKVCHPPRAGNKPRPRAEKMMQTHIYLSNDNTHDATYVQSNMDDAMRMYHQQRRDWEMEPLEWLTLLSDGGPGHYKQGRNFFNMSKLKLSGAPEDMAAEVGEDGTRPKLPMHLHYLFLGPNHGVAPSSSTAALLLRLYSGGCCCHHCAMPLSLPRDVVPAGRLDLRTTGKNNWDGIIGVKKMQLAKGTLWGANGGIPLDNAEKCTAYLESRLREKTAGKEKFPFPVQTGSTYSCEVTGHHFTAKEDLEDVRVRLPDVTTVPGTRDHYDFTFDGPGALMMRWLSCPCVACWDRDFEACKNAHMVGQRVARTVTATATTGVAAKRAQQKRTWERLAQGAEVGDIVACYSDGDVNYPRVKYWLGKVTRKPYLVTEAEGIYCPTLGEAGALFRGPRGDSPGEHVVEVKWLERKSTREVDDLTFEEKCSDPHLVHANTLRLGKIELTSHSSRRRTLLTLPTPTHTEITAKQQLYED